LALKYGKKYYYLLERMGIKDLVVLPSAKQRHVMKALAIAKTADPQPYTSIYAYFHKRGLPMRMNYCRKIFGTHLRYYGIESEMVNLLEGRISPEIFVRHYWSPNIKQDIERIRKAIDNLADQLV